VGELPVRTDGVVTIRTPAASDIEVLIAGRDEEFRRFLGDGDPDPKPTACVLADGTVVGWVDYDHERVWLGADEVNLGYNILPEHRGRGYGTRAVRLLLDHLAEHTDWRVATLLIHPDNERSLALARRAGFTRVGDLDDNPYWKKLIPPASTAEYGPWAPLDVATVVELFSSAPFRWWISGGLALELHLGQSWRAHDDIDIGVLRQDAPAVRALLKGWDLHVAASGQLSPWHGEPLDEQRHQNNVWGRAAPAEPWCLDLTVGSGTTDEWIYRRDPSLRLPWHKAVLRTEAGIAYLAPDLQLLFKSQQPRPKDDLDAATVIPHLEPVRRERLRRSLPEAHSWRWWLRSG
jgi:L-amino acid N-acyltransferase YncA